MLGGSEPKHLHTHTAHLEEQAMQPCVPGAQKSQSELQANAFKKRFATMMNNPGAVPVCGPKLWKSVYCQVVGDSLLKGSLNPGSVHAMLLLRSEWTTPDVLLSPGTPQGWGNGNHASIRQLDIPNPFI